MGGGQLGRMFSSAAARLGYRVHVFEPEVDGPAALVSAAQTNAAFSDVPSAKRFAGGVAAATIEFENIPWETASAVEGIIPLRPGAGVLRICQNRRLEKEFLLGEGFPVAPFRVVDSPEALDLARGEVGLPGVLKTSVSGYDGKGQQRIVDPAGALPAWDRLGRAESVFEAWVDFAGELSVVCARSEDGSTRVFPASENIHRNHILDVSIVPSRFGEEISCRAEEIARSIAAKLGVVGLLAVEFFVCRDGGLLVNELAPRPHNSGHFTMDCCSTSQFEQQVRALCGLPLGDASLLRPAVMINLLGDLWKDGPPDWSALLAIGGLHLHLYGKKEPRPGRKMGHINIAAESPGECLAIARKVRGMLGLPSF